VDNLSILHELIYEIFTDPCWRGSRLPNDNIEIQVRSILERLGIEERRYREIIRQQEDLIKKLAYKLDNYTKFGY
jgi:hypothetical protein